MVVRKKSEDLIDLGQYQSVFDVDTYKQLLLPYLLPIRLQGKDVV